MKTRQTIDIEDLLQWAYCQELPKQDLSVESAPWSRVDDYAHRGGMEIDEDRSQPQRYANIGTPHPDALALEWLVRKLEPVSIIWPAARQALIPDLSHCLADSDPNMHLIRGMKEYPEGLVAMHARMKTRPRWDMTARLVPVKGKNNKPYIHGVTAGRRYADGAHCPMRLDPPIDEIISARFEYFVWRAALVTLANESCELQSFAAQHPRAAQAPWLTGPERSPRILATIRTFHKAVTTKESVACES